jgi:outer membrane biosynthesis protein TonB
MDTDVVIQPLQYPRRALQNEVSGQVVVALTFDAEGKPAPCRPLGSRMSARLAYETCAQVKGAVQLKHPPDARPYVLSINWLLGERR